MNIKDWSQFVSFDANVRRPTSLDELKKALSDLSQGGSTQSPIRVLGGLHSCSKIFESDAIIDMEDMPNTIEFNHDSTMVTASTNWHLSDFLLELSKRDKSLSATGGTNAQTLSGLISTDTAPATPKYGMYELLEWVDYITLSEDGKSVVEKHVSKNDPEFPAVVCSLGAIGILTKVQFRLIDQSYFETVQKIIPLKEVLEDVSSTSKKYDFWRINWLQNTEEGLLWEATEIPREQADPDGDYTPDQAERILKRAFMFLAKLGNGGPLLDSIWKKLIYWVVRKLYKEVKVTGPLRNMLPVDRYTPLHVAMAEWYFDPDDLNNVLECCRKYFKKNRWPNLPIEIELAKTDNYFMSPLNFEGLDYIVKFNFQYMTDVCTESEKQKIYVHLEDLWNHLIEAGIQFRAHWGKVNFMDYNYVRDQCKLDQFQKFIRPEFLNSYLAKRLTPPS